MIKANLLLGVIGGVALTATAGVAHAVNATGNPGYWLDSNGNIVRNGSGECWHTIFWSEALAVAECEPGLVKKPAASVAAKPTPAPAVAAPAPAAPPAESWKTSIIEKPVRLEGASFASGSSKLLPGAASKLDEVVNAAKQLPDVKLDVRGYTDNVGNAQNNLTLSQGRADAVKGYLVEKGVAADRISSKGYGSDSPIADNGTAEGRAKNRRVEVHYAVKEEQKVRAPQQ